MKWNSIIVVVPSIVLLISCYSTSKSCTDDPKPSSYCTSCLEYELCPSSLDNFRQSFKCSSGQYCLESGTLAFCSEVAEGCECTSTDLTQICDPYNNTLFLTCINGNIAGQTECSDSKICSEGACTEFISTPSVTEATDTTNIPLEPTDSSPSCNDGFFLSRKNCTAYYICSNGQIAEQSCKQNQVVQEAGDTVKCINYVPFTCPETGSGIFGDTFNCNIFYTCQEGTQLGKAGICPDDAPYFDSSDHQCKSDEMVCTAIKCTPCIKENSFIGLNCTSYYECHKDGGFYTVLKNCPPNFYFNDEIGKCQLTKPSGC